MVGEVKNAHQEKIITLLMCTLKTGDVKQITAQIHNGLHERSIYTHYC